jgi:hypothetical protein
VSSAVGLVLLAAGVVHALLGCSTRLSRKAQDVRAVFTRPGVVVATSGPVVPAAFRAGGAATALFVRTLPTLVGEPADAASIPKAAR